MEDKNLSDQEKKKKQEEITKRLNEIKQRLSNTKKTTTSSEAKKAVEKTPDSKTASKPTVKAEAKSTPNKVEKKATPVNTSTNIKSAPAESPNPVEKKPEITKDAPKSTAKKETLPKKAVEIKMAGQPTEEKKWAKNQLKADDNKKQEVQQQKEISKKTKETNPKPSKEEKKSKRFSFAIIIVISLLVLGLTSWYLLFYNTEGSSTEMVIAQSENSSNDENEASLMDEIAEAGSTEQLDEELTSEDNMETMVDNEPEEVTEEVIMEEPMVEDASSMKDNNDDETAPSTSASSEVMASKLETPCFVISYVSTSSKSNAQQKVSELSGKGLSSGFYWIPDYNPNGAQLFKVFVGPYPNRKSAHDDLERIRGYKKDVYYHIVE